MDFQILLLGFIPMFSAFDTIGIVPMYKGLTGEYRQRDKEIGIECNTYSSGDLIIFICGYCHV